MKKILIISFSTLHNDPRVLRQIQALKNDYQILTIGDTPANDENIIHYNTNEPKPFKKRTILQKIVRRLKLYSYINKNYHGFYPKILAFKNSFMYIFTHNIIQPDLIIANESSGLYLASNLNRKNNWNAKIYFDAHEYTPKADNSLKWRLFREPIIIKELLFCKQDISIMSTVSDGIAKEYEKLFNFQNGFIKIITNAPEYNKELKPKEIKNNKIKIIHHGSASKTRRFDLMFKMMDFLNPEIYELTLMLVPTQQKYYNYLLKLSKKYKNIKFIDPVPFSEIVSTLNSYDIGIFLLLPEIFNFKYALPNKLFEYIQARLAIAIGPSIEMVKIVKKYNLGIYSKDFTPKSLAESVKQLTPENIMEYKINSDIYAKELSAENNINIIRNIISELSS